MTEDAFGLSPAKTDLGAAPGAPWGEPFTYDGILKESPDEQHQD